MQRSGHSLQIARETDLERQRHEDHSPRSAEEPTEDVEALVHTVGVLEDFERNHHVSREVEVCGPHESNVGQHPEFPARVVEPTLVFFYAHNLRSEPGPDGNAVAVCAAEVDDRTRSNAQAFEPPCGDTETIGPPNGGQTAEDPTRIRIHASASANPSYPR